MANDNTDYLHLASNKIFITCKTCGVRESFYSELSVGYFRLRHAGHELVEETARSKAEAAEADAGPEPTEPSEPAEVADAGEAAAAEAPQHEPEEVKVEAAPAGEKEVKVDQVVVEARASPDDGTPIVQVRGLGQDGKDSFVVMFKLEEAAIMREFLGSGRYEPQGEGTAYVWDPLEVRFEWNRDESALPAELKEMQPPTEAAPPSDSVAASMESMVEEQPPPSEIPAPVSPEPAPEPAAIEIPEVAPEKVGEQAPEVVPERVEPPAEPEPEPEPAPRPAAPAPKRPRRRRQKERPAEEKHAPKPKPTAKQKAPKVVRPEPAPEPVPSPAPEKEEALLLAKSSYLQEGEEIKREAVRISRLLKAFRWNVEPVYTIGVMVDDNMSIETSKGEISGTLLRQIEGAGYRLSAVTISAGKPTAWFKRKAPTQPPIPAGPEGAQRLKVKVNELSRRLKEEKRRAEERNALWEESLRRLMKSVKGEEATRDSPEPEDEPLADTDVTS